MSTVSYHTEEGFFWFSLRQVCSLYFVDYSMMAMISQSLISRKEGVKTKTVGKIRRHVCRSFFRPPDKTHHHGCLLFSVFYFSCSFSGFLLLSLDLLTAASSPALSLYKSSVSSFLNRTFLVSASTRMRATRKHSRALRGFEGSSNEANHSVIKLIITLQHPHSHSHSSSFSVRFHSPAPATDETCKLEKLKTICHF